MPHHGDFRGMKTIEQPSTTFQTQFQNQNILEKQKKTQTGHMLIAGTIEQVHGLAA